MKFIVTKELGKLSRWLRIAGFDTLYFTKDNLGTLIITALRDQRTIVTRKRGKIDDLEKNTVVISSENLKEQLAELFTKLSLVVDKKAMFSRCTLCNEVLQEAKKDKLRDFLPPYVYMHQDYFMQCPGCKKIYWRGSHWGNIKEALSQQLEASSKNNKA
ncbi:MAG: Mut7-C RNAse domain-containing protein [Candidatus Omnitrophica bacterium]|nr:Mut7-C RNAse domain-containing protein [Candidatus Omnitrophota bacterium]